MNSKPQLLAVNEREKRTTAGTRMNSLVGQAAKDDDEFWNHSTWIEDEDGSFHESDEESDAKHDKFDSDFDDSEDEEEEEIENGERKEEIEILTQERREKRAIAGKRKLMDVVSAGRELLQKRKNASQRKKALRGDGINAGLVLNVPASSSAAVALPPATAPVKSKPISQKITSKKVSIRTAGSPERKSSRIRTSTYKTSQTTAAAKRSLRTSTINNTIQSSDQQQQTTTSTITSSKGGKRGKRRFTQEELILEAVQLTEAENERWLLSRKRIQNEENTRIEMNKKLKLGENNMNRKTICKYNSKRGCYNTLTFPSMDHVPEIFTRPRMSEKDRQLQVEQIQRDNSCVITGKKARYRDPKTGKGYHDLNAFKELRRRLSANECLYQSSSSADVVKSSLSDTVRKEIAAAILSTKTNPDESKSVIEKISTSIKNNNDKSSKVNKEQSKVDKLAIASKPLHSKESNNRSTCTFSSNENNRLKKESNQSLSNEVRRDVIEPKLPMAKIIPSYTKQPSHQMITHTPSTKQQLSAKSSSNSDVEQLRSGIKAKNGIILPVTATNNTKKMLDTVASTSLYHQDTSSAKESPCILPHGIQPNSNNILMSKAKTPEQSSKIEQNKQKTSVEKNLGTKQQFKSEEESTEKHPIKGNEKKENINKSAPRKRTSSTSSNHSSSSVNGGKQIKHGNSNLSSVGVLPRSTDCINGINNSPFKTSSNTINSNMPFITPITPHYQNTNMSQQNPLNHLGTVTNPSMYNTLNQLAQLSSQQQFFQPSALDIASLYAINLSQQSNLAGTNPLQVNPSNLLYTNQYQAMLNGSPLGRSGYPNTTPTPMLSQQLNLGNARGQKEDDNDKDKGKMA